MEEEELKTKIIEFIDNELTGTSSSFYYAVLIGVHSEIQDRIDVYETEE